MTKDILIIGSDGKLGASLMKKLSNRAIGTTRKANLPSNRVHLDLLNDDSIDRLKKNLNYKYAILVAAISEPNSCYLNPELSRTINVNSVLKILMMLKTNGITPIFLSTEMVFNGQRGFYSESDKPEPTLLYGKQKLIVEEFILQHFNNFIIVRLAKIYSSLNYDNSILNKFFFDIQNKQKVYYATDQYFSPTLQDDFEDAILGLMSSNIFGLFHLSSGYRISRWEFFQLFANEINNFGVAKPCLLRELQFLEPRPPDLSLNGQKLSETLGFNFKTPRYGVEKWIANYRTNLSEANGWNEKN